MFAVLIFEHQSGNFDAAFMIYVRLAERGYEVAQSNAAYLLDQGLVSFLGQNGSWARALALWNEAADQNYAEARLKVGDYHYYGRGTPMNHVAAAHEYQMAVDLRSAQVCASLGHVPFFSLIGAGHV